MTPLPRIISCLQIRRRPCAISTSFLVILLLFVLICAPSVAQSEPLRNYSFGDLQPCPLTSLELSRLSADESIEPCILYDIQPSSFPTTNRSTIVTSVQVTPHSCHPHRDGAVTAAQFLNADNDQQGVAIGFRRDYFVQFRHVSVIAGNPAALGTQEYNRRHVQLLESMVVELGAQYIAGTCSFAASIEKEPARRLQRMVITMVGPPAFYTDGNPYVFGIHINSDNYGRPAIQQLAFLPKGPTTIPIRIIYRKQSEFFFSTCQAVVEAAQDFGFVDVETVLYEHDDDHDGDGTINEFDEDYLGLLADQICPPIDKDAKEPFHPAIFACTRTEQNILLQKWRENGCQPYAMWMTPSTWEWALENQGLVPYFQGGGQWHPALTYGDRYFDSGAELLTYNEKIFGYRGSYDMVVSYAILVLFAQHLQAAYRILDDPDPQTDFSTPEGYEILRRDMIVLNVETIFGTVSFNEFQRNEGRGAAGTQWLPIEKNATIGKEEEIQNFLISPFLQAEVAAVAPAPVAEPCDSGSFNNLTRITSEASLMVEKCSHCPVDTFTDNPTFQLQCEICPAGSSTELREGQTSCITVDDTMVGTGLHVLGYFGVFCTWCLAIYFFRWTIFHHQDPVVKIGQPEFLLTICVAAMVSSASVIFLSFEAGSDESDKWADLGCQIAPFLYAAGWVTEYSSLSVKTYRLYRVTANQTFRRVEIHSWQMFAFIGIILTIELTLVVLMTVISPLEYVREITNRDVTDNLVTIKTSGSCSANDGSWAFLGPIIAIHVCLQIGTNWLLFKVRGVNERYQEQKYVALASLFVLEVLVIGVPVLVAVQDSPAARFIVMTAIVILNDIGILCFVFIPKQNFQKIGLPEGIGVAESINRAGMNRVLTRRSQSFTLKGKRVDLNANMSVELNRESNGAISGDSWQSLPKASRDGPHFRRSGSGSISIGSECSSISPPNTSEVKLSIAEILESIAEASAEFHNSMTSPVKEAKDIDVQTNPSQRDTLASLKKRVQERLSGNRETHLTSPDLEQSSENATLPESASAGDR